MEKNSELLKALADIETAQNLEWADLEKKVESTLSELRKTREENTELQAQVDDLREVNMVTNTQLEDLNTKYLTKKSENLSLRNKCMHLTEEISKLELSNQDAILYINEKEKQQYKVQKKLKVIPCL